MKTSSRRLLFLGSTLLLAGWVVLGTSRAAEGKGGRAEPKSEVTAEQLRRYDRNGNGRLDPDEEAAMRADEAREKRERERKKKD